MPYLRCPKCSLLVHMVGDKSADAVCPRCSVPVYEEARLAPNKKLSGLIGTWPPTPSGPADA